MSRKGKSIIWENDPDKDFTEEGWTLKEYLTKEQLKRMKKEGECEHKTFVFKCSCCGKILGSETFIQDTPVRGILESMLKSYQHTDNSTT